MKANDTNDGQILQYLLGQLSEDEQSQMEGRYFEDDEFYREIRAAERDLIDSYVSGKLTAGQRELFENRITAFPALRRRTELARSFHDYIAGATQQSVALNRVEWWRPLFERFSAGFPIRYAVVAATIVLMIGCCAWLIFETTRLRDRISEMTADQEAERRTFEQQLADERRRHEQEPDGERNPQFLADPSIQGAHEAALDPSLLAPGLIKQLGKPPAEIADLNEPYAETTASSPDKTFSVISPVGTFVLEDRPTFQWERYDEATGYQVFLLREDMPACEVVSNTKWKTTYSLKRGEVYAWYVVALKDNKKIVSKEAKFKVVREAKAEEVEQAKKRYFNSPLNLGIVYAQAGLLDDAEREFQKVIDSSGGSREVRLARQLRDIVKASRRPPALNLPR